MVGLIMGGGDRKSFSVSVVMIGYNAERYLREAFDSLMHQSFRSFEVVFVDDGSNDKTPQIADEYASKYSNVRVYHNKNTGAGEARNFGFTKIVGEYVIFLDSDDIFSPNLLNASFSAAKEHDADIVLFRHAELYMKSGQIRHSTLNNKGEKTGVKLIRKGQRLGVTSPAPWNKLYRADFIRRSGLRFLNLRTCNDVTFTMSSLLVADKVFLLPDELVTYRNSSFNVSSSRYKYAENICIAWKGVFEYIQKHELHPDKSEIRQEFYSTVMYELSQFPKDYNTSEFIGKALAVASQIDCKSLLKKKIIKKLIKKLKADLFSMYIYKRTCELFCVLKM